MTLMQRSLIPVVRKIYLLGMTRRAHHIYLVDKVSYETFSKSFTGKFNTTEQLVEENVKQEQPSQPLP